MGRLPTITNDLVLLLMLVYSSHRSNSFAYGLSSLGITRVPDVLDSHWLSCSTPRLMPRISPRHLLPLLCLFGRHSMPVQIFPGQQQLTLLCSHWTCELILHLQFLFSASPSYILCNPLHRDPRGTNRMPGIHSLLLRGGLVLEDVCKQGFKIHLRQTFVWVVSLPLVYCLSPSQLDWPEYTDVSWLDDVCGIWI